MLKLTFLKALLLVQFGDNSTTILEKEKRIEFNIATKVINCNWLNNNLNAQNLEH